MRYVASGPNRFPLDVFAITCRSLSARFGAAFAHYDAQRRVMRGKRCQELCAISVAELEDTGYLEEPRQPREVTADAGELAKQGIAIGMMARFRNCTKCGFTDESR